MARRPLMTDASSREQNAYAERVLKDRAETLRAAVQAVMAIPSGRLLLWELLSIAGVNESVMSRGREEVLYMAGRQDLGHDLQAMLYGANEDLYDLMAREAHAREKREEAGAKAVQASPNPEHAYG